MVPTPGHAPHHVAFLHGEVVFGGEVAGTRAPVGSSVYRRPATPPRFKPDVALASIDRLLARSDLPPTFAFGHWGLDPHAPAALARGRDQIERWVRLVDDAMRGAPADEPLDPLVDRLLPRLLDHDPDFAPYRALPPDVRSRERTFIANSIAGMRGYLREEAGEEG
jgi:glyoxylase-like metal-dependent hydrolase (beta-lactamase superfamily II)